MVLQFQRNNWPVDNELERARDSASGSLDAKTAATVLCVLYRAATSSMKPVRAHRFKINVSSLHLVSLGCLLDNESVSLGGDDFLQKMREAWSASPLT